MLTPEQRAAFGFLGYLLSLVVILGVVVSLVLGAVVLVKRCLGG